VSKSVGNIDPTHRFNGKELDPETGLYYYGGRYYDPEISRFISADPFIPQPGNPQSLNRYSYTLNNPQNYIDPSGFFFGALFKAIGNFFKSIFKNPGVFFATLTVGIITGGVGYLATSSWVLAGAIGGAAAGAVGAGMTGGNIWQGALIGGIAGGAGGGTFGALGGVKAGFGAVLGGALVGGATAGALNTAFNGGNFMVNVFSGAITSGITAAAAYVAWKALEERLIPLVTEGATKAFPQVPDQDITCQIGRFHFRDPPDFNEGDQ
jgi:RHS repeat-associated protein